MKINFKEIGIASLFISSCIAYAPQTAYAESLASLCRRNAPYAADAAAGVNDMTVVRTGRSWVTAYHYDAVNPGGTFVTGCEAEVVFNRSGLVNLRYNVHEWGDSYYVGSAPFNY